MAQESRLAIVVDSKTSEEQVKALAEALRILEGAGVRVTGVSEETSKRLQSLAQDAGKGSRGIADLSKTADTATSSLTGMATALASVVSTAKLFGQIQSSMQAAARFEQLGLIVEVMGRNAGIAAHELVELEKELQKTGISMIQSRQVIAQLVQANIDLSHATNLARLAQDAATIAGIGSSEALGRLITGIQTSQVEILRNMGVVVSFENSYKSLADQLGRTTASLSESEKMAARVNAVLEQGGAIAGSYEISMTNALKQAGSMVRLQEDLNVLMGQMYQPAYSAAIEGMSATIKEAQGHAQVLSVALAGVTAAAATATIGVLAFSKSFGVLRIAMNAIAAHPVMMVLSVAVGVATALGVAFSHAGRDARTAAIDMDELTRSLQGLNAEQLAFRQQQAEEKLASLEESAAEAARELKALEKDYAELVKMFEAGRGVDAEGLENVNKTLVEQQARVADANQEVEKARGVLARLDEQARITAGGISTLNDALAQTNEAGKTYLERLADQAITAGLKTQREQLEALVAAGKLVYTPEDLEKARKHADHIDRMNASLRTGTRATNELASAIESLLDTHLPHVAALNELHKNLALLDKAQKAGIVTGQNYVKALESINKAYAEQVKSLLPESIKKVQEQVKAARDQERQLRQQVRTFGLAESAVLALAAADTDAAIAKLEATKASEIADGASIERIKHIEEEIQVLRELRDLQLGSAGLQGQLEWREQQRQQWESWARDVEQIFDQVGQSLTDQLFDGGKRGLDMLKDWAKTLTLRIFVQPVMSGLQAMVTGVGPGGIAAGGSAAGGMMGSPTSLFSMLGGNSMGMGISNVLSNLSTSNMFAGTGVGNWMMGTAGNVAGMSNLALGGAGLLGGIGAGLLFGNKGYSSAGGGLGATAGMALGGPIGAVAGSLLGGALGGLFGGREPTTRRGQSAIAELRDGQLAGTRYDDRQGAAATDAVRQIADAAFQSTQDIFRAAGISAVWEEFYALTSSSYKGDQQGVASGGRLRIGDQVHDIGLPWASDMTKYGVGGWSEADMMPRLAADVQITMLEALQHAGLFRDLLSDVDIRGLGDAAVGLAEVVQARAQEIAGLQIAVESLPFANLRDLSFSAAESLIRFAGGLENLDAGMTSYFQNFYSEAEQIEWMTDQMSASLSELGFTMPDLSLGADAAKASLRQFVEGLDVTQEEGARAFAGVMNLAGSYAELAAASEEMANKVIEDARRAAEETQRIEDRIASERYSLETQLLQLQGDTITLRMRELDTIDAANRGLQQQIWTLQDAAAAQQAYERSIQSVTGSLAGIRETVLLDQLGSDEARYGYFKQQADGLARLLPQLTDESAITQTISQIASLTGRAYGLLDDEQKQSMGGEFLDYIDRTETIATRQIQAIQEGNRQAAKEQAEANAQAVAREVGRIADAIIRSVDGMPAATATAIRNAVAQNTGQRTTQYREVEFAEVNA